jgi:two-component system CheB/CheR fusion protein
MKSDGNHPPQLVRWLAQSPGVGVLLIDTSGHIQWGNRESHIIFGATSGGLIGAAYRTLFTPEDRAHDAMETELIIAQSRGYAEDDRWHLRIDGSRFWASGILSPVVSEDGVPEAYVKVVRNRTDLKEQLVALHSEIVACRRHATSQAAGAAEAAHEIRNCLTGVMGLLGMLRRNLEIPEPIVRMVDMADRQLNIVQRLTEDLLGASAKEHSVTAFKISRQAIQPILSEALELCRPAMESRNVRLLAPQPPIECNVDCERLLQAIVNLLRNSLKFTHADGNIWIKLTVEGSHAVIRIEDDGVGIAPTMLEKIFEAFTQADNALPGNSGVGLGLTVAKETVTLLGGSIQAQSDGIGQGAAFSIRLPMAV